MKSSKLLLTLLLLAILACTTENNNDYGDVTLSASGLSDGKLAINSTASFTAEITDYEGDASNLSYRWSLATGKGVLSDGSNALSNPTFGTSTIGCVGQDEGAEQVTVEVLDTDNNVLGTASLSFEIIAPDYNTEFPRGCYDQPKIYYQRGGGLFFTVNFDGNGIQSTGFSGGLSATISPDGEWMAWNPYQIEDNPPIGYSMYIARCDGTELTRIPTDIVEFENYANDYIPQFSHDSKTLYFMRPNAIQNSEANSSGYFDLAAYDLETGQVSYLTSLYQNDESVSYFSVSPVTGEIALIIQNYTFFPDGSYGATTKLSFLQPASGLITDFATLPSGRWDLGMDWSPDGGDIILNGSTTNAGRGMFRIDLTDGSQPILLLPYTDPDTTIYNYCYYYAGGSRIVFGDYTTGTNLNLYSVDANGDDLQLLADIPGATFLQGVLE